MTTPTPEGAIERLTGRQRDWALNYMAEMSFGRPQSFDTGTTYDCGTYFCEAFLEEFPGRKPDPNFERASKRLAAVMRLAWEDGHVRRAIQSNEKYLREEPSWQYVYTLFPSDWERRKEVQDRARAALTTPPNATDPRGVK